LLACRAWMNPACLLASTCKSLQALMEHQNAKKVVYLSPFKRCYFVQF